MSVYVETPKLKIEDTVESVSGDRFCRIHDIRAYENEDGTFGCPRCTNDAIRDFEQRRKEYTHEPCNDAEPKQ